MHACRNDTVGSDTVTLSGNATLAGANAGAENITSFAGLTLGGTAAGNYTLTGASGSVNITAAMPTLNATDASGTYNGNPFSASATAAGIGGSTVSGSFTYAYYAGSSATGTSSSTAPSNAGTYTAVASFTSSDPNYSNGSAQTTFTIVSSAVPPPGAFRPPTVLVLPLLAFFNSLLRTIETINANRTETLTASFFGIPLLVSTFNSSGNLESVTLLGINVTILFELF